MDTTGCPECDAPAEVVWRAVLESTDGPVEHTRITCARGHWFLLPVAALRAEVRVRAGQRGMVGSPSPSPGEGGPMRILLLCSTFNGLTQRAWLELRAAGHEVTVQLAGDDDALRAAVTAADPDLILCPFLRDRVPADVCRSHRVVVIHPGPRGDRGPSSLDWAIMDGEPVWGVTAVSAVQEFDAGSIWGSRTFPVAGIPAKSGLYHGPVTDAAVALIHEVVARAADGSPGVHTTLRGVAVAAFDAHPAASVPAGAPGAVVARRDGAVLVRTGDGGVWVGHLRSRADDPGPHVKLPATTVLAEHLRGVPQWSDEPGHREIDYHRDGDVGVLTFRFYHGAMSTAQCRRLLAALRHAIAQDTRVLLLRGGQVFSNGVHLGVIEAAADPAAEAWANIVAIDDVCREIITCTQQLVLCSVAGNAGAGGVMLALGADRVLARDGVVLNPHYATMGLYGSEYWTYVLPRRVGELAARSLTRGCQPIGAGDALRLGLADEVLPGDPEAFEAAALRYAAGLAGAQDYPARLAGKHADRAADERRKPLRAYRRAELVEMSADIFEDRHGFAHARAAFLTTVPRPRHRPSAAGGHR